MSQVLATIRLVVASPKALLIGDWSAAPFANLRSMVDRHAVSEHLGVCEQALELLADGEAPELVIVAQARPGSIDPAAICAMQRRAPLTRIVLVAGSWCEGELRTGRPIPGTIRLYWHEFAGWWRGGLEALARGVAPPWSAVLDEPRAGSWLGGDASEHLATANSLGGILINAADYHAFAAIQGALAAYGWRCVWQPRFRPERLGDSDALQPSAGIFDAGQLGFAELACLHEFAIGLKNRQAPTVVLLDFPRPEHVEQLHEAGAAEMQGKPFQVCALAKLLGSLA